MSCTAEYLGFVVDVIDVITAPDGKRMWQIRFKEGGNELIVMDRELVNMQSESSKPGRYVVLRRSPKRSIVLDFATNETVCSCEQHETARAVAELMDSMAGIKQALIEANKKIVEMRLEHAGVVGLLCRLSPWAEEEDRDSIEQAAINWTIIAGNGWDVRRNSGGVVLLDPEQNAARTDL